VTTPLRVFFDTFVEPGSTILICEPTFPMYRYYAENLRRAHFRPALRQRNGIPLADVVAALRKKPRVVFIANPNNPTGTPVPKEELLRILKAATHTAVVMDEAYGEFSGFSAMPWNLQNPQLFVAKTFFESRRACSLRLGAVDRL